VRVTDKTPEPGSDRHMGPLAALMRSAEPLEELTAVERERIRHRLRRDLLPSPRGAAGFRWSTVLAAFGLLLVGGAVSAAAGHFGLIPWPREARPPVDSEQAGSPPRRPVRPRAVPTGTVSSGEALPSVVTAAVVAPALPPPPVAQPPSPVPVASPPSPRLAMVDPATPAKPLRSARVQPVRLPGESRSLPLPVGERPPASASAGEGPLAPRKFETPPGAGLAGLAADVVAPAAPRLAMVSPDSAGREALVARSSRVAPAPASASNGQAILGQAINSLRNNHDAAGALDILTRHAALFPHSPLAAERSVLEIEALLALGRRDEALARLDGMSLDNTPRGAERHVVRGELRARAQRWRDAIADFDQALTHANGTKAWQERALWGRAVARARAGDEAAARADLQTYLRLYPKGRFASEAARLLAAAE